MLNVCVVGVLASKDYSVEVGVSLSK